MVGECRFFNVLDTPSFHYPQGCNSGDTDNSTREVMISRQKSCLSDRIRHADEVMIHAHEIALDRRAVSTGFVQGKRKINFD